MEFERVRTDEQRRIRVQQIKDAAIKLFDAGQFHEIDLTQIARETSFTRGNLYKYISSKEEIYLLVIEDELNDYVNDLKKTIVSDFTRDTDGFAKEWAQATNRHPRMLKLLAMLATIIERNVSLEKLVHFKRQLPLYLSEMKEVVKVAFPAWSEATLNQFVQLQTHYASGLFPTVTPSPLQREAHIQAGIQLDFPDFATGFTEFISYTADYLNRKNAAKPASKA
ncbi:TetR/AcrR family transcriptional regulator [Saccharibacillus sp. CPCC 101409]|uniref:TetR/AcrR family transcriptional regulator n=1 Tax=Saccharibacillus sp. CPCC 101409 TaxID=3058041 RepID=UPI00267264F7|nr:TetR/AcrR family transcriptional regulator [Saccharibacillus sp. CPCC 101409]MDO3412453.1 TetR/AcrR family transcriptional regulator [Saccharibacillus sp. CPCC 101409]